MVYNRLGADVTVIEFLDAVTPGMDAEIQKTFQRTLKKQGIKFVMGAAVQSAKATKTKAKVTYKLLKDDSEHVRRLVSEGSRPRLPWGLQLKQFIEYDPESDTAGMLSALTAAVLRPKNPEMAQYKSANDLVRGLRRIERRVNKARS